MLKGDIVSKRAKQCFLFNSQVGTQRGRLLQAPIEIKMYREIMSV